MNGMRMSVTSPPPFANGMVPPSKYVVSSCWSLVQSSGVQISRLAGLICPGETGRINRKRSSASCVNRMLTRPDMGVAWPDRSVAFLPLNFGRPSGSFALSE